MSRPLQLCAYAARAGALLKRTAHRAGILQRERARFYEDIWRAAASEVGAEVEIFENGVIEISRDGSSTRVWTNCTALDDPVTVRVACDKPHVHATLRAHGLPTPDHVEFSLSDLRRAYAFSSAREMCVVKPADGTGAGEGVTTGVVSRWQALRAALRAAGYGPRLLIEEQVRGDTFRLLYLDGELLDAVGRFPPTVVGDGRSRISGLVRELNQRRVEAGYMLAQTMLCRDLEMTTTLARQGLSWRSVPVRGRRVVLKTVINDNVAAENRTVRDELPERTVADGRRAAELVGVRLAGVDIVTPDIRRSLEDAGGVILEVNTMPGYHYHYHNDTGPCPVAVPVLKACLSKAAHPAGR